MYYLLKKINVEPFNFIKMKEIEKRGYKFFYQDPDSVYVIKLTLIKWPRFGGFCTPISFVYSRFRHGETRSGVDLALEISDKGGLVLFFLPGDFELIMRESTKDVLKIRELSKRKNVAFCEVPFWKDPMWSALDKLADNAMANFCLP